MESRAYRISKEEIKRRGVVGEYRGVTLMPSLQNIHDDSSGEGRNRERTNTG